MFRKLMTFVVFASAFLGSHSNAAELNVAHLSEYIDVGYGYNPVSGKIHTPCSKPVAGTARGQENSGLPTESYRIKEIFSRHELTSLANLNAYASAFTPNISFRADMQKILKTEITQEKTHFYVSVAVTGITIPLRMPFELTAAAIEQLSDGESSFKQWCGDSYISALKGGGEFVALISMEKLTNSEAKEFRFKLDAAANKLTSGAAVGADDQNYFARMSSEKNVDIDISQSGYVDQPLASLTDVPSFLERARMFSQQLRAPGAKLALTSAFYSSYTNSVEFGKALKAANKKRFSNFDTSTQYMAEIVKAYDDASDALSVVRSALSRPDDFKPFDVPSTRAFEVKLTDQREKFATLARACSAKASNGELCEPATALVVEAPKELVRLEPCTLPSFREKRGSLGNTCTVVAKSAGECHCTECSLFQQPPYTLGEVEDMCVGMRPNTQVVLQFSTRVRVSREAQNHWIHYFLETQNSRAPGWSSRPLLFLGNRLGNNSEIVRVLEDETSPSGDFRARIAVRHCQSSTKQVDECTSEKLGPAAPAAPGLLNIRTKMN